MVAIPSLTPVITPLLVTEATEGLLLIQVTVSSLPFTDDE
jgi:hypothetical protein